MWADLQQQDTRTDSPFFCAEFTQLVDATRGDVEVAVLRRAGQAVGFLPFQRKGADACEPVGAPLNDFQGPIVGPHGAIPLFDVAAACGLSKFAFDHVLEGFGEFESSQYQAAESPYMDLSQGFDAYADQVRASGSAIIKKSAQYVRKVEREIGPVRLVWRSDCRQAFDRLIEWKSHFYEQTDSVNILAVDWIREFVERLQCYHTDHFSGLLTALYAGDELLAVHLGMQSGPVLHWWLPTYNPQFASYSPGTILLTEVARYSSERGIERIDLGKGAQPYKERYRTGASIVWEGVVDPHFFTRTLRDAKYCTRNTLRDHWWGATPLRMVRQIRDWWTS